MRTINIIVILILVALISTLINYTQSGYAYIVVMIVFFCVNTFFLWKEIKVLWRFFTAYMFNIKTDFFDKKIEKPRLFIYLTFGTITLFSFYQYLHIDTSTFFQQYFVTTALLLLNTIGNTFLWLTWQKNFEQRFIIRIQKQILKRGNSSFQFKDKEIEYFKQLFNKLSEYNFIEVIDTRSNVTDIDCFSNTLYHGIVPEEQIFKLNMDNIQTKYLWDNLSSKSDGFTLDKFLSIFKNNNKGATRKSIETSASKATNPPKRQEDLDQCLLD